MNKTIDCKWCSKHYFCTHPKRPKWLILFSRECVWVEDKWIKCKLEEDNL
jgi:hypothetical protein